MRLSGLPWPKRTLSVGIFIFLSIIGVNTLLAQCPNNVLPNPGFEQGLGNWTILGDATLTEDAVSGSFAVEIGDDGDRIFQTLPAVPGNEYGLTFTWRKLGPTGDATAGFKFLDAAYIPISFHLTNISVQTQYATVNQLVEVAPPGTAFIEITAFTNAQSPAIHVDDFCLIINGGVNNQPDLRLDDLQGTFTAEQGGDLLFTLDLINQGSQIINTAVKVGAFLSTDDNLSPDDSKVGELIRASVPIGIIEDIDFLVSIPFNFPIGFNRLFLIADSEEAVFESNEYNNVINIEFEVKEADIDPPTCELSVSIGQGGEFFCSNNGTPDDPDDDTWGLPFFANNEANMTGSGWRVTGHGLSFTGAWGEEKIISGFPISSGLLDLTVVDLDDSSCLTTLNNIPPPATCSNGAISGCADNLLPNSGFEDGLELWTVNGQMHTSLDAAEGTNGLSMAGDGNRIYQTLSAEVGDMFALSAQARKLGNDGAAAIGIKFLTETYDPITAYTATIPIADFYTTVSTVLVEAPLGTFYIEVNAFTDPGASAILVDDFCLRKNEMVQPPGNFDFSIIEMESQVEVETGSEISFSYKLNNSGDTDYTKNLLTGAYISEDAVLSADDTYLGVSLTQNALVGTSSILTGEHEVPHSLESGEYYLILKADDIQEIVETSELNNTATAAIKVIKIDPLIPVDCEAFAPLPRNEYLAAVEINKEEVRSEKKEYSDFRNVIFDIPMQEDNQVSLTVAFEGNNYEEYFRIYVDFNQDDWYAPEELYYEGTLDPGLSTAPMLTLESGNFDLSHITDYRLGVTSMRVLMSREGFPEICGMIANGDVEDYSVNIVEQGSGHFFTDREGLDASELKVYPNPADDFININLEDAYGTSGIIYLTNSIGQVVWLRQLEEIDVNVYSIDTSPMGPGIYGVWLKSEGASAKFAKVMVKQH